MNNNCFPSWTVCTSGAQVLNMLHGNKVVLLNFISHNNCR